MKTIHNNVYQGGERWWWAGNSIIEDDDSVKGAVKSIIEEKKVTKG